MAGLGGVGAIRPVNFCTGAATGLSVPGSRPIHDSRVVERSTTSDQSRAYNSGGGVDGQRCKASSYWHYAPKSSNRLKSQIDELCMIRTQSARPFMLFSEYLTHFHDSPTMAIAIIQTIISAYSN